MYGFELTKARRERRRELRRELRESLGPGAAIDMEDLLDRLSDPYPSAQSALLRERCVLLQLRELGADDDCVAAALGLSLDELHRRRSAAFFKGRGRMAEIDRQILDELPETPEPGRYVAAADGRGGPVDPYPSTPAWPATALPRDAYREDEPLTRER